MKSDRTIREQKGAAAVEFAVLLPLFLLIVFGIVEWSLYLFNEHIITDASRRGARFGISQAYPRPELVSASLIEETVLTYTANHLVTFGTQNQPRVNKPPDPPLEICTKLGDNLEVIVRYDYTFLLLPALTAGKVAPTKTITARTVMKCE